MSPQTPPVFKAGVDVAEIDVSVLDKARKPVRGLTVKDFAVFEDGKPQSIVAFAFMEVPAPVPPPAKWMSEITPDVETNDIADRRLFVIIVDDALNSYASPSEIGRGTRAMPIPVANAPYKVHQTKAAAIRAVEGLGPDDEAAVIFTGAAWDSQGFTTDHKKLIAAIDRMRLTPPTAGPCGSKWGSTDALQSAAEALAAIPHRKKVVLYISVGPMLHLVGPYIDPICDPHAQASAQAALVAAQRGNVVFYGIDPKGLTVSGGGVDDPQLNFLDDFSSNTGGRMIARTNDPVSHVPEILAESSSYYLLGYEISGYARDGRFHRLEVKVPDHPEWEVLARKTRFDPKPVVAAADAAHPPPSATDLAISDYVPSTALRMEAAAAPFAGRDQTFVDVALGVQLPKDALAVRRDEANLLIRAFTVDGRLVNSVHENVPVTVEDARFELSSRIDLKPGRYTLHIAVHSKTVDKTGSVYTDVVVPDYTKEPLSVSGVVMTPSSGSSLRGDALAALTPTSTRAFDQSERMQSFVRIYQGGSTAVSPVAVKVRIVDEKSVAIVDHTDTLPATSFSAGRQADYSYRLPLSTLKAGQYWLSIEATIGKRSVRRDVRFSVR